ncbi:MAG: hypothetical protein JNK48_23890, partial [Bryobacterales bacterium]|nr:hypothetical protein [Bryobacterales bacterium]
MTRRHWLLLFTVPLRADERQDIVDWLGRVAQRLSEENSSEFLRAFEKNLRDRLESAVHALVRNYEAASSVHLIAIGEAPGNARQVQLDWFLSLKPRSPNAPTIERRERLTLTLQPAKKGWLVQSLSPLSFFD